jgi:DNA helicase MCM8
MFHATKTVDWQRVRIQEKLTDDQVDSGRVPRSMDCELSEDLVDSFLPGDVVYITGIVKVLSEEEGSACFSNTYIAVCNLTVKNRQSS